MNIKWIAMAVVIAAVATQVLAAPSKPSPEMRADENAHKITDADEFLLELDQTLELARAGDYGKIAKADYRRLDEARDSIATLLAGHDHARQLTAEQRIELYDQQQLVTSIIRDDEKNRRICKRVKATGTRLAKAECMTVEQREARARQARQNVQQLQQPAACRGDCTPTFTGG